MIIINCGLRSVADHNLQGLFGIIISIPQVMLSILMDQWVSHELRAILQLSGKLSLIIIMMSPLQAHITHHILITPWFVLV